MRNPRHVRNSRTWLTGIAGALVPAATLVAQFIPAADNQTFDFVSAAPPGVPFVAPNWSLDPGCSTGMIIAEGSRQSSAPNALKILRGGTGTRMIIDLNPGPGSSTIGQIQSFGNDVVTRLYLAADANTGTNGREVYRVYQVLYPTTLLEWDINEGPGSSNPANFFRLSSNAGHVVFSADDGITGTELYKAHTGTNFFNIQNVMLKDINPDGSSNPSGFATVAKTATAATVFAADDGTNGRELWRTDGVLGGAGTAMMDDLNETPGASSDPQSITSVVVSTTAGALDTRAFFTADDGIRGRELWRTDGTTAGTGMVEDIVAGATGSNPSNLTGGAGTLSTMLFFTVDSDGANGAELWKSGGALPVSPSTDGPDTELVKDLGASPANLKTAGDLLFFTVGNALWKSNGTNAGTVLVQSFTSINSVLVSSGAFVYFAANDGVGSGVELWSSDGTTTSLVKDINPGAGSSSPANLFVLGSRVYFSADDGTNGRELWRNDTTLGALMVLNINPGAASSDPANFNAFDGTVVFTANDGTHGTELWQTDGNAAPTQLGISHKLDLVPLIQNHEADKVAVAGTDLAPWATGIILDAPTQGGGNGASGNHFQAKQVVHQINFLLEVTDGIDRAPIVVDAVDCGTGDGWTRPRASLTGDGQPHNVIAAGLLAIMDQAPCDTSAMGPQSPAVPLMEVPVVYDGLNWIPMDLAHFPTMQSTSTGGNSSSFAGTTALPAGLAQATLNPYGTKRFSTLRIDILSNSFRVLWGKRQGGSDEAVGDTIWVVTVPRQYTGAFKAAHIGAPTCVPSAYEFFADNFVLSGGQFTTSLSPFGACCPNSGQCANVSAPGECAQGVFSPWVSCSDPGFLCCPTPWADGDGDGDVDFNDFGLFQACFTSTNAGVAEQCRCWNESSEGGLGIDLSDFEAFKKCVTGPSIPFNLGSPPAGCTP